MWGRAGRDAGGGGMGLRAALGEIPAASAGMTDLFLRGSGGAALCGGGRAALGGGGGAVLGGGGGLVLGEGGGSHLAVVW